MLQKKRPNRNWAVGTGAFGWTGGDILEDKTDYVSVRWYQLLFQKKLHEYKMFIDGKIDSSATLTNDFTLWSGLEFGFISSSPTYLDGNLDDIRVYNRALSAGEVAELYALESGPRLNLIKAVKPAFDNLYIGTNYQLQVSGDLLTWTNSGSPFTATNGSLVYPQYWDVANWNDLFFHLRIVP